MSKPTGAKYEKARRDNEAKARDQLEALIPAQYFTQEVAENGLNNKSTKILLAAVAFMQSQNQTAIPPSQGSVPEEQQVQRQEQETEMAPSQISELEESVGALLEAASTATKNGPSAEAEKLIQQAIELCDDMTEAIKQEGWDPEKKRKWQHQQAEWAKIILE